MKIVIIKKIIIIIFNCQIFSPIDRVPTDVVVDLGKELSLLNTYLDEMWTDEVHSRCTLIDKHLIDLRGILIDLAVNRGGNAASVQNANGGPAPVIHQVLQTYREKKNPFR